MFGKPLLLSWLLIACTISHQAARAANEVSMHELATRPGVTVQVMLIKPEQAVGMLLIFPGGNGLVTFNRDGTTGYRGFPVKNPAIFARHGFVVAVINAPSDQPSYFRRDSRAHTEDVARVLEFLRQQSDQPLWLVGHSAGSTSVANVAIELRAQRPMGIVLMSSENGRSDTRSGYLDPLKIEDINLPVLVIHHRQDECPFTLFSNAQKMSQRLKSSPRTELLSFSGGGPVTGDTCGSLHYHGYPGIEEEVAARVAAWIKAQPKP